MFAWRELATLAIIVSLVGCHSAAATTAASSSPSATASAVPARTAFALNAPLYVVRVGRGVECKRNGITGAPSYRASDIGRAGVPTPKAGDLTMLRKIMQYVNPKTLRFTYLRGSGFTVFESTGSVCAGPVGVLNAPWCGEAFMPSDVDLPTGTELFAGPGGCFHQPRPWMPLGGGDPKGIPWSRYQK